MFIKKILQTSFMTTSLAVGYALLASSYSYAENQNYDLVINNGRVMDPETNYDQIVNVGIKDGKIVTLTKESIYGNEAIDATNLVVAPGFIDPHFHGVDVFATKMALRDGVTTAMDLELGATQVKNWYDKKGKSGWQVNYGTTTSHPLNRLLVHDSEVKIDEPMDMSNANKYLYAATKDGQVGWERSIDTTKTMDAVSKLLDEDLRQGALGLGAMPGYMSRGLTTYSLYEAQRVAARYGRLSAAHLRFSGSLPPTEVPHGFNEAFTNAAVLKAPLLTLHNNNFGWWEIEEKLKLAREQGYNMWSEHYPYESGSTMISADSIRPELWEDTYHHSYEDTIYDPAAEKFFTRETFIQTVKDDPARKIIIFMPWRKDWLPQWLKIEHMTVASDGMAGTGKDGKLLPWGAEYSEFAGHPRTSGTHAKVLRLGREQNIPLMHSLSQLSYWSALHLGDTNIKSMKARGRLQVGKIADITIFDQKTVTENSSHRPGENGLASTGIPFVIVNGTIVVKDSKVLEGVKPGQPIRYPVEAKGRFESVTQQQWINETTIKN